LDFKEWFYQSGNRWEFSIDLTRWLLGVEWYREWGWVEINLAIFKLTVWWKKNK
jgi:hypothetical protein